MWAEWGVKHEFRQQANKKLKRGWEGGMQGNLELLNSVSWEGGESTCAVTPARASRHTLGELWWNPTLLSLVCREPFRLRLLLLPPCRAEEKGFPNTLSMISSSQILQLKQPVCYSWLSSALLPLRSNHSCPPVDAKYHPLCSHILFLLFSGSFIPVMFPIVHHCCQISLSCQHLNLNSNTSSIH